MTYCAQLEVAPLGGRVHLPGAPAVHNGWPPVGEVQVIGKNIQLGVQNNRLYAI